MVATFSLCPDLNGYLLTYRATTKRKARWQAIFEAFTPRIWIATFLSCISIGITHVLILMFHPAVNCESKLNKFFKPFKILCIEPVQISNPRYSSIIIWCAWLVISTLLIGFYSGNITSLTAMDL